MELIDFQTQFSCVAPLERKNKFDKEIVKMHLVQFVIELNFIHTKKLKTIIK